MSPASGVGLVGRFRAFSTGKRVQKVNDLLLSGGRRVEFAAHLREPSVDMIAEVDRVFSKRVEAGCCRLPEIAEVTSDRADVAIGGTGQHSRGSSVALACLHAPGQAAYLMLESRYPRFEIPRLHALTLPAPVDGEAEVSASCSGREVAFRALLHAWARPRMQSRAQRAVKPSQLTRNQLKCHTPLG